MRGAALILVACAALLGGACGGGTATSRGETERRRARPGVLKVERGKATYYGGRFHGRLTASGERFDQNAMTAAHKKLPFGTRVRVTNLNNGRSVVLRINDRGPYGKGRIIDVSTEAARRLDMMRAGVVPVTVEVLELGDGRRKRR